MRRHFLLIVGLAPWLSLGCGASLAPALEEFEAGRLPEARAELRRLEADFSTEPPEQRARYGLYRGLTALALGNAREADHWLSSVKLSLDRQPRLLTREERGRLLAAWHSMGRMPGE